MIAKHLVNLLAPGSGCGDIRISSSVDGIRIEYEYRCDGVDWIGCVDFVNVAAFRFRDELHSVGFCSESYDAVAIIDESPWLLELIRGEPINKKGLQKERHYAVFLSNNGYFETIAETFEMPASRKGLLPKKE